MKRVLLICLLFLPFAANLVDANPAYDWYKKGSAFKAQGRYAEALEAYTKAIELDLTKALLFNNRGNILSALKRYKDALADFDQAIKLDPKDGEAWYNKGNMYLGLKQFTEAEDNYSKSIERNPKDPEKWHNYALAVGGAGRFADAIPLFDKAITIKPDFLSAQLGKLGCLNALKRFDESENLLKGLIQQYPQNPTGYAYMGLLLSDKGEHARALQYNDKAAELAPKDPNAWGNKGSTLMKLGKYQEALAAFNTSLELKPDYKKGIEGREEVLKLLGGK